MTQTPNSNGDSDLKIRPHTRERLEERSGVEDPIPVEEMWDTSITIENPKSWGSEARLYEPYELVIVKTWNETDTVIPADYSELNTEGLVKCDNCKQLTQTWSQTHHCHWCDEPLQGTADNGIEIRLAGDH